MNRRTTILCAGLALAFAATAAQAQTVKLRVGDSLPANHFFTENATKFWMAEVTKRTSGAVTFEHYPAEQLGKAKDLLSLTQTGVVDVGYVVPAYVTEKMPLTSVAELPGTYPTSCAGTLAYWKLARGDAFLAKREYEPNGVKVMFAIAMPPYQVFSTKPMTGLASLEGQKIQSTGGAKDAMVHQLKAVPVRMAAPELHEALSRGTVDGMVFPTASVLAYDLAGLVKSGTSGENFGSAILTMMISNAKWNTLTPAARTAMLEAGDATTRKICEFADRQVASDVAAIRAKGANLQPLPASDKASMGSRTLAVRKEWAQQMDGRGKPGTEALAAFDEALK